MNIWRTRTDCLLAVLISAAIVSAGCNGRTDAVDLPDPTSTAGTSAPATASSPTASPEEDVRAAYLTYWKISPQIREIPNKKLRSFLKDYYAEPFLTEQIRLIIYKRIQEIEGYGQVIPHIVNISIDGDKAVVTDCQDASSAGITNKKDPSQSQKGEKRRGMTMTMVKGDAGRWRTKSLGKSTKAC